LLFRNHSTAAPDAKNENPGQIARATTEIALQNWGAAAAQQAETQAAFLNALVTVSLTGSKVSVVTF